jgi:hypothetical protein
LTPNVILHLAIFITTCEAFLGIDPHWGLWKKIFFVKHYSSSNGSFITGGVGFVVRKEVNYFNFPMRESVQGWRLKWFYLKEPSTAGSNTCLPKFANVLEAVPKKSWKNTLTTKEKIVADRLYERILEIKSTNDSCRIRSSSFNKRDANSFFFPEGKRNSFDSCLFPFGSCRACKCHRFSLFLMMILPLPAPESMFGCLLLNVDSKEVFV